MTATRLTDAPIISPATCASIGVNIQGPSLIRVPDWIENPLGQYYLYFADHKGKYIRLAYANDLLGPWTVHIPGSLHLRDSRFPVDPPEPPSEVADRPDFSAGAPLVAERTHDAHLEASTTHIASPDVHVRDEAQQIVMYFHGLEGYDYQCTRVAVSRDGINFKALPENIGRTYFRVFKYRDWYYALAMPGLFYRSKDGLTNFETGPLCFNEDMRHSAVLVEGDTLKVYWTQVGETPERILLSTVDLSKDWSEWRDSEPREILRPEFDWEGANAPLEPSIRSTAYGHVNQLRDPAVYQEGNDIYLLYAVAGESGIAIAKL